MIVQEMGATMTRSAYRRANQRLALPLGIWLTAIAAALLTAATLSKAGLVDRLGGWMFGIVMLPMIVVVWLGWRWLARLKRRRIARIAGRLADLGFKVAAAPTLGEKAQFGAPIAHLMGALELRTGAAGIEWFAERSAGATKLLIFEHEHVTGTGKTAQPHHHTVIAWPARYPDLRDAELPNAGWFIMAQHPWWIRRKVRERELKQPEFADVARQWSLFGEPATARRFLTPGARVQLEQSPRGEAWCVGQGWICTSTRRTLDEANVDRFLSHVRSVLV